MSDARTYKKKLFSHTPKTRRSANVCFFIPNHLMCCAGCGSNLQMMKRVTIRRDLLKITATDEAHEKKANSACFMLFMTLKLLWNCMRAEGAFRLAKASHAHVHNERWSEKRSWQDETARENHFQFHSQLLKDMQSKSRSKVCKI